MNDVREIDEDDPDYCYVCSKGIKFAGRAGKLGWICHDHNCYIEDRHRDGMIAEIDRTWGTDGELLVGIPAHFGYKPYTGSIVKKRTKKKRKRNVTEGRGWPDGK